MRRRTKIVATLGPATDDPAVLEAMLRAGADVVRINFSHGGLAEQRRRVEAVRATARKVGREVGVLGDLQGPKIRVARFVDGKVTLQDGDRFTLDAARDRDSGDQGGVGITYELLPQDVSSGDTLLLDDGQIVLEVESVGGSAVHCVVRQGGVLSNSKGINRQGGGLSAEALTDKDRKDIRCAAAIEVDYLALSFPRDAADVRRARALLEEAGGQARICAKIERAEAVENIDEILVAADVVMVARGDLGVEIGDAKLPGVQKMIIERARMFNRVTITATQMMESMITSPVPTRAEVLDVANAVIDGTDAVMLSAETAAGAHPVRAVEAMDRVCHGAERDRLTPFQNVYIERDFEKIDEAIAMATMYTANKMDVRAIIALTESGSTALWLSRVRSGTPIFALTRHESTLRRVTLYRGVYPVAFDVTQSQPDDLIESIVAELKRLEMVRTGDHIILTRGEFSGVSGQTNTMKIITI